MSEIEEGGMASRDPGHDQCGSRDEPTVAATAALACWRPIETAPKGQEVLVWWPAMAIDEKGNLTGELADRPGHIGVSSNSFGGWEADSVIQANEPYFHDDFEFGDPTLWMPLPPPPEA